MSLQFTPEEMNGFLHKVFPQIRGVYSVEELSSTGCVMRLHVTEDHLRPGGTVSGPAMFGLADVAAYAATMAQIGPEALTVTTNASFDFMRKPDSGRDMIARATILKLGRSLSVIDILLFSEGLAEPVARSTMTYSIPPKKS